MLPLYCVINTQYLCPEHFPVSTDFLTSTSRVVYRGCQKNVPIKDRFSVTNPYAAILFSEHYYDKRYNVSILSAGKHSCRGTKKPTWRKPS